MVQTPVHILSVHSSTSIPTLTLALLNSTNLNHNSKKTYLHLMKLKHVNTITLLCHQQCGKASALHIVCFTLTHSYPYSEQFECFRSAS